MILKLWGGESRLLVRGGGGLGGSGSPEFEEVVGQANELPFGVHLGESRRMIEDQQCQHHSRISVVFNSRVESLAAPARSAT